MSLGIENDERNERYKQDLYSNIFFAFKKNEDIVNIFDDTMADDLMDQALVQIICSLGKTSIELVKLSKIS